MRVGKRPMGLLPLSDLGLSTMSTRLMTWHQSPISSKAWKGAMRARIVGCEGLAMALGALLSAPVPVLAEKDRAVCLMPSSSSFPASVCVLSNDSLVYFDVSCHRVAQSSVSLSTTACSDSGMWYTSCILSSGSSSAGHLQRRCRSRSWGQPRKESIKTLDPTIGEPVRHGLPAIVSASSDAHLLFGNAVSLLIAVSTSLAMPRRDSAAWV